MRQRERERENSGNCRPGLIVALLSRMIVFAAIVVIARCDGSATTGRMSGRQVEGCVVEMSTEIKRGRHLGPAQ